MEKITEFRDSVNFGKLGEQCRLKNGFFSDTLVYSNGRIDIPKKVHKCLSFLHENKYWEYKYDIGEHFITHEDDIFFGLIDSESKRIRLANINKSNPKKDLFVDNWHYEKIGFVPFKSENGEVPVFLGTNAMLRLDTMDELDGNKLVDMYFNLDNLVLDKKSGLYSYRKDCDRQSIDGMHFDMFKKPIHKATDKCLEAQIGDIKAIINGNVESYSALYGIDGKVHEIDITEYRK